MHLEVINPSLIHPLLVHFPIALLSLGVLVRFMALTFPKKPKYDFLLPAAWLILAWGVVAAWVTVITGEIAADIVAPTLKNIETLKQHEIHAYRTALGFTVALSIDLLRGFLQQKRKGLFKKRLTVLFCILYLFSLGNLIITGYYGASLVYEQGAAVLRQN